MPALKKKKILRRLLITAILLLAVFVSLPYIVSAIAKQFTSQEQKIRTDWQADSPLAVINPYGTGSNGLYLYFSTDYAASVRYTISVENDRISDFTATAREADGKTYTRSHEIQLIGLVPGEINTVTLFLSGSWGNVRQ